MNRYVVSATPNIRLRRRNVRCRPKAQAVADEAAQTPRFGTSIIGAVHSDSAVAGKPRRTGRRSPGIFDPLAVYLSAGESGLRKRLGELGLEQLRDIVAEHGMDHDKLAMKWKDPGRVIERIVERVITRSAKGSAFRSN